MGDPRLSPFLGVPTENEISHDPSLDPEVPWLDAVFHLTAEPNSYVGLTRNGALIGHGLVGASGSAEIEISGHGTYGTVRLCVTCQDRFPYRVDIPITPAAAVADGIGFRPLTLCNAPNPFGEATEIRLSLPQPRRVSLCIHDLAGRLVKTALAERLPAGTHQYTWDGRDAGGRQLPEGVYIARLTTDGTHTTHSWKLILSGGR